jgi:hypothetical protein
MGGSGRGSGSEIRRCTRFVTFDGLAVALLASLGAASSGCANYVPATPRVASADQARIRVVRMKRMLEITHLELQVERAGKGTVLHEVSIARRSSPPCRFGWAPVRRVVIHDAYSADDSDEPALKSGDRVHLMYGAELSARLEKGTRLDVLLSRAGSEICVSLPFTDEAAEARWERDGAWSFDFGLGASYFAGGVGGVQGEMPATFAIGHRFDESRFYGGVGVGAVFCSERTCPPEVVNEGTPEERRVNKAGVSAPLFLGFDSMPWQTGHVAFGTALEYQLSYTRIETYDGPRANWFHGPVLAPRIAVAFPDRLAPGLRGGPANGFVALDFPVGIAHSLSVAGPVAPRIGMRLQVSIPLD